MFISDEDDFITDRPPTGELPDYSDGTSQEPISPRPRRRLYTPGRVYSDSEKRRLHAAVDLCCDRRQAHRQRAADGWHEDLVAGVARTEAFGRAMLSDLSRRYIEHNQQRWPGQTHFLSAK